MNDGAPEHDDTLPLLAVSTDDGDYSGIPRLAGDDDSEISETDAYEIDDVVETITVDDDTLERDDRSSLSAVSSDSTDDEDYSRVPELAGDTDSDISETDAHETENPPAVRLRS